MTTSISRWITAGTAAITVLLASPAFVQAGNYTDPGDSYQTGRSEPAPWRGSAKDEDGYPVPQPPSPSHQSYKDDAPQPPPPPLRRTAECLSKFGIRGALNEQGWHAFEGVEIRGSVAFMSARNDNGRRFDLQIDSCTGTVIEAHPVTIYYETPPPAPYYVPRPAVGFRYYGGGYGGGHGGHRHWR
jgi:hypothetical protein